MTADELAQRVLNFAEHYADDEKAHAIEDAIHVDTLRAIADGAENPAGLASIALQTADISFSRWCA